MAGPDLTAFSTTTGAAIPWSLSSNGQINALTTDGRRLYIGGNFSLLSGSLRLNLASVDLGTAALTSWNPSPDSTVDSVAVSAGAVYAAGLFNSLPGYGRPGVAAFSTTTGGVLSFNPATSGGSVADFAFHRDRVALVGSPAGFPLGAFRWVDRISGATVPPASFAGISAEAGAQTGDTIYAVGTRLDGSGSSVASLDAPSGRTTILWDFGFGFSPSAVAASRDYVAVGARLLSTPSLVVFQAPRTGAPRRMQASVAGSTITLSWEPSTGPTTTAFVVEAGTAVGAADVGVFDVGLATRVAGALPPGTYYLRVRGVGANGPGAASSEVIATVPSTSTPPTYAGFARRVRCRRCRHAQLGRRGRQHHDLRD